jgi:hypothetical protein
VISAVERSARERREGATLGAEDEEVMGEEEVEVEGGDMDE